MSEPDQRARPAALGPLSGRQVHGGLVPPVGAGSFPRKRAVV
jgi:hypothetical protein